MDFENAEPVNAQVLKIISGEILTCPGGSNTDGTEKVQNDCFTDADTSSTEEVDEPCNSELLCGVVERQECCRILGDGFPFDNLDVIGVEQNRRT